MTVTLILDEEEVGTTEIQLHKLIGEKKTGFRARIGETAPTETVPNSEYILVGDPAKYPGASIEIHLKIEEPTAGRRSSTRK